MSSSIAPYHFDPIALSNESTVVAEYEADFKGTRETTYQSEAELERLFIEQLKGCLLYTSPSPRDLSTSRMPSSA